ncbi:MAG TPA: CvpA family protein [Candidatus Elarobacter sp.]
MSWPDLVIVVVALILAFKGWKRGFVSEIGGFIALAAAVWAAIFYPGTLDGLMESYFHLGTGSAHVVGMIAFAILVYVALMVLSAVLGRVAKLPVIGIGNAVGGAVVGLAKTLLATWAVIYVVLFFPISPDFRRDLHNSQIVEQIAQQNPTVDAFVRDSLPWFVRPFAKPLFDRHHV